MESLANAGATIDLEKFLATRIEFLGHLIDQTGAQPLERNIAGVKEFPQATVKKELLRFIGWFCVSILT